MFIITNEISLVPLLLTNLTDSLCH